MVLSLDSRKYLRRFSTTSLGKANKMLHKLSIKRTFLKIIKTIYVISITNITPDGKKLKALPLGSGTGPQCPHLHVHPI